VAEVAVEEPADVERAAARVTHGFTERSTAVHVEEHRRQGDCSSFVE